MKKRASSFKKNSDGIWELDGVLFPFITKIKADKCLNSLEFRETFHPNDFVHYCLGQINREVIADDEYLYFALATKVEGMDRNVYPIPLCMLDFSDKQIKEIMMVKHYPKKAFEKSNSRIKENFSSDEITPFVEEDQILEPENNCVGPTFGEGFYGAVDIRAVYSV
jgi:hypothetical protein